MYLGKIIFVRKIYFSSTLHYLLHRWIFPAPKIFHPLTKISYHYVYFIHFRQKRKWSQLNYRQRNTSHFPVQIVRRTSQGRTASCVVKQYLAGKRNNKKCVYTPCLLLHEKWIPCEDCQKVFARRDSHLRHRAIRSRRHQMDIFSAPLAFCAGNSLGTGQFSHKGQWRGAFMFSLICTRINCWVNNRKAGYLRRHRAHCDVIVICRKPKNWTHVPRADSSTHCEAEVGSIGGIHHHHHQARHQEPVKRGTCLRSFSRVDNFERHIRSCCPAHKIEVVLPSQTSSVSVEANQRSLIVRQCGLTVDPA